MRSNTSVPSFQCHALICTLCCSQDEAGRAVGHRENHDECHSRFAAQVILWAETLDAHNTEKDVRWHTVSGLTVCLHSGSGAASLQPSEACCSVMLAWVTLVTVGVTAVIHWSFIHSFIVPAHKKNKNTVNVTAFRHVMPASCLDIPPSLPDACPSSPHSSPPLPLLPPSATQAAAASGSQPLRNLK